MRLSIAPQENSLQGACLGTFLNSEDVKQKLQDYLDTWRYAGQTQIKKKPDFIFIQCFLAHL